MTPRKPKKRQERAYHYEAERAKRAIRFLENLPLLKGEGARRRENMILMDWTREEIVRPLFGMVDHQGYRQYRQCFVFVPKKNAKSHLAAGIGLLCLYADNEPGAEVYGAAHDREQAEIVFNIAAGMVRGTPALDARADIIDYRKRIIVPETNSFYHALDGSAKGSHGYDIHCLVFDELHEQEKRDLWDSLTKGTISRKQPLVFAITTAGHDRESICYEKYTYAKQVKEGTIVDPQFLPVIYEASPEDDWQSEETWRKANPGYGITVEPVGIEAEARMAAASPAALNNFLRLHLNIWTQQVSRWITPEKWAACQVDYAVEVDGHGNRLPGNEDELAGLTCYGGLDLGAVSDLTAWALAFPYEDDPEMICYLLRAWCPEARLTAEDNKYRAQYQAWARQGWLKVTSGETVDYSMVKQQIIEDATKFSLVDLAVDRLFQGLQLSMELIEEGLLVAGMGQGYESMAAPTSEFERRVLNGKIEHNGNPLFNFAIDNTAVKMGPAGITKPDKAASQGKIDPVVAAIMALDRAMRHEEVTSNYETEGLTIIG